MGVNPVRRIDCSECVMAGSDMCGECVMSYVVGREPGEALVVDAQEERALRLLGSSGLVPGLRHRARAS